MLIGTGSTSSKKKIGKWGFYHILEPRHGEGLGGKALITAFQSQTVFLPRFWHFQYLFWGQGGFCTLFLVPFGWVLALTAAVV